MKQYRYTADRIQGAYALAAFFFVVAGALVLIVLMGGRYATIAGDIIILTTAGLVAAMGLLPYRDVKRFCITIDDTTIQFEGLWLSRSFLLTEIMGYRTGANGQFVLDGVDGRMAAIPRGLEDRDELLDWLRSRYNDSDEVRFVRSMEEMNEDERFGESKLARLQQIKSAMLVSLIARIAGIVLLPLDLILSVNLYFSLLLFAIPWIGILCIRRFNGMVKLYRGRGDAQPSIGPVIWLSCALVATNAWFNYDLYRFPSFGTGLLVVGVAVLAGVWWRGFRAVVVGERQQRLLSIGLVAAAAAYAFGLMIFIAGSHAGRVVN